VTIKGDITRLTPQRQRGKLRLPALSGSRTIAASKGSARPTASSTGMSFTESSRSFYPTLRTLRSSDGLFVLRYYNVRQIIMGNVPFTYLDYDPS
jgi:hypothetical protein